MSDSSPLTNHFFSQSVMNAFLSSMQWIWIRYPLSLSYTEGESIEALIKQTPILLYGNSIIHQPSANPVSSIDREIVSFQKENGNVFINLPVWMGSVKVLEGVTLCNSNQKQKQKQKQYEIEICCNQKCNFFIIV